MVTTNEDANKLNGHSNSVGVVGNGGSNGGAVPTNGSDSNGSSSTTNTNTITTTTSSSSSSSSTAFATNGHNNTTTINNNNNHHFNSANGSTGNGTNGLNSNGPGHRSLRILQPSDYVGFDSLPEQYVNRTIRDGFVFNVMVIGATGVGKSTLVDSLFNTRFPDMSTNSHDLPEVQLNIQTHELQEKHIKLRLSVIETQGFCDQINKVDSYRPIVKYVDEQFEKYLQEELKMHRSINLSLEDTRVHCCLYLLPPTGHGLRAIDLVTMKQLHTKVNLIPIIAKSDIITKNELQKLRSKIMAEITANEIQIYKFPTDDHEVAEINGQMNALTPFAVVASHDFVKVGSKHVRARQYAWGVVQVENENHSDFTRLREVLLRINMEDLRESTHLQHYEHYRRIRLEEMGFGDSFESSNACSFQETFETRRNVQIAELKRKTDEMKQSFVVRIKEKEAELKEAENEIHAKFEALKRKNQEEKKRLEDERRHLEDEISNFSLRKTSVLQAATLQPGVSLGKQKKK